MHKFLHIIIGIEMELKNAFSVGTAHLYQFLGVNECNISTCRMNITIKWKTLVGLKPPSSYAYVYMDLTGHSLVLDF